MAPSRQLSPENDPAFIVLEGRVHMLMPGRYDVLEARGELKFNKSGGFAVEYTGTSYGIIRHTTRSGRVMPVFIPPQKMCFISNGFWNFVDVNYQSYLDELSKSFLVIALHGERCGKLKDSDPMVGPPIGPFYTNRERQSWRRRFEGIFEQMMSSRPSSLGAGRIFPVCQAVSEVPNLGPRFNSFLKPDPAGYVRTLTNEIFLYDKVTEAEMEAWIRAEGETT